MNIKNKIRISRFYIATDERNGSVIGICPRCGKEIEPIKIKASYVSNEQPYYFCSEECLMEEVLDNKPEKGY